MIGRKKTTERKSQMNDSDVDCRNKKKNNKCIKSAWNSHMSIRSTVIHWLLAYIRPWQFQLIIIK